MIISQISCYQSKIKSFMIRSMAIDEGIKSYLPKQTIIQTHKLFLKHVFCLKLNKQISIFVMEKGSERDALTCPITRQLFSDPVKASDGKFYERSALLKLISQSQTSTPQKPVPTLQESPREQEEIKQRVLQLREMEKKETRMVSQKTGGYIEFGQMYDIQDGKITLVEFEDLSIKDIQESDPQNYHKILFNSLVSPQSPEVLRKSEQIKKHLQDESTKKTAKFENQYLPLMVLAEIFKDAGCSIVFTDTFSYKERTALKCLSSEFQDVDFRLRTHKFHESYDSLSKSPYFLCTIKEMLCKELNIRYDDLTIYSVNRGSIIVQYEQNNDRITEHRFFKEMRLDLSLQLFDPRGNRDFKDQPNLETRVEYRGGWPYFFAYPWKRYGLRVLNQYDNGNNDWLMMDSRRGEWAVAFHGVRQPSNCLKYILKGGIKNYLQAGGGQAYSNDICRRTGVKIGNGVYVTPLLSSASQYAKPVKVGDDSYQMVFQCRVRPNAIRVCKKQDYWVINESKNIRPYGVVLFKCEGGKTFDPKVARQFKFADYSADINRRIVELGF